MNTTSNNCLKNQTILLTGASNGIGRALAKGLARCQADLILLDKDIPGLESLSDEITKENLTEPGLYPLDLSGATQQDYLDLVSTIEKTSHQLDAVIHNATLLGQVTPFEQYNMEMWYKVMQVNLNGPALLTQACLPLLRQSKQATLLFTSDPTGVTGKAYWGAYGVTKYALEGFMQMLSEEYDNHPNLLVCSLDPGAVQTHLRTQTFPAEDITTRKQPEDIVHHYIDILTREKKIKNGERILLT